MQKEILSRLSALVGPAPQLRTILGSRGSRRLHPVSYRWRVVKTLLQDDSGLLPEDSVRLTGYQYVDWQFDGDDLIYVVRTASRVARNFHDSNRILFGRERGFRSLL